MIIPIRCMNCGFLIADKWRIYQAEVARRKQAAGMNAREGPMIIDGSVAPDTGKIPETIENAVLKELGFTRYCCKKHFLTHRDLTEIIS